MHIMHITTPSPPSSASTILSSPLTSHTEDEEDGLKVTIKSLNLEVGLPPEPTFSFSRSPREGKSYAAIASSGTTTITTITTTTTTATRSPNTNNCPNTNNFNVVNLTIAPTTISPATTATTTATSVVSAPITAIETTTPPSPPSPTPLIMSLLRLIVKNNPTGVPEFQITTPTPFVLSHTFPSTSPYTIIPSQTSTTIPLDLSRTLNTRHIRVQDDLHDLVLSNWKKSVLDQEDAKFGVGNRRVRLKIYEINEWLTSRGWGLLGSHVESYEGGFFCDVHTYLLAPPTNTTKRGGRLGKKGGGKVMGTKASERALVARRKSVRTVREEDEGCERE